MSAISFYILYGFLRILSYLPFRVLYIISDGLYYILYYISRYRLKVVKENLRHAFPLKTEKELLKIEKAFYRHFSDMFVETLKMIRISPDELSKRIPLLNPEILDKYREQGRSIMAIGAHYGNWEWTVGIVPFLKYKTIGVYKPLNNKRFDKLVKKLRCSFNVEFVSMKDVPRVLFKYKQEKTPSFNVFVADQSPIWQEIQYWLPFLNQITAVYLGPEKLARQFNMVVLYGKVAKTGRGRYSVELIPLEENPLETKDYEITGKFIKAVEDSIFEKPEYWLWSHRRWKHTRRREDEESRGIFRFSESNVRN
jgi:Kdo2-lipid IVA lauroyltransferase/acyltransferase